ncbi:mucin-13 [Budorcas taxicolor]|uniref:mucin-13 n=1 Tax=Budorcas taxicolor TaxID=37181 RepID=UPI002284BD8B|nr:mucin-13 [Budorcas taxicolor]
MSQDNATSSASTVTSTPASATSTATPTTTSPPTTDTTAPPGTNTSTAANATAPPGPNNTSTAANATAPPGTNTPTAANATSGPSTPCKEDSCKDGSLCVNLHDDYFCLCSEGYYYKSSKCNKGKIFPGTIKVTWSYTSEFENKTSEAYQNLYIQVTTFFKDTFNNSDYGQTVIVKVSPSASARSEMRAGNQGVDVAVVNIFTESTKETETSISNTIRKATNSPSSNFTEYDPQDRCNYYGCKKPNDQNDCDSGLLCECKEGLARPNPQIPMCVASCSDTCNAEHKRQCLVRNESAACVCLPGYKEDDQRNCQACAFGYSGVNCEDSFQLILTIVGTIAGVFILGMLIAHIVSMRLKNKGRDVEEETLIEKDSQNLRLKETGFSNLGAEGSIFPKVRVNLPRDSESQNPYTGAYTLPDY